MDVTRFVRRFAGTVLGITHEQPEYPKIRLVEVSELRSVFRVSNETEDYRVSELGDEGEQLERFAALGVLVDVHVELAVAGVDALGDAVELVGPGFLLGVDRLLVGGREEGSDGQSRLGEF